MKKRCTAFVISDFIDDGNYDDAVTIASRKHDMVALQVYDRRDAELPDVGLIYVKDSETGEDALVDTGSKKLRMQYRNVWNERQFRLNMLTKKSGIDAVSIMVGEDYVKSLMQLFNKRK